MSKVSQEIASLMGDEVASDPKLLAECENLCKVYNLTPQELQFKWEAAIYSSVPVRAHEGKRFTIDSLASVRAQIKREMAQSTSRKAQPKAVASSTAMVNRARMPPFMNRNSNVNVATRSSDGVKTELDVGTLNTSSIAGPSGLSKVTFRGPKMDASSRKERGYRYMYEKLGERSEVLDDRIEELTQVVQEHYGIEEIGDPTTSTDDEIITVGRITHDLEVSKLTEATLTFEPSRQRGNGGARIPLRFDPSLKIRGGVRGAGGLGLFPGAITALKGKNSGTGWFSVTEILALPPLNSSPSSTSVKSESEDQSFSMYIACGPYTTDANLKYKPWQTLLKAIKDTKPTVILLLGPFVDTFHPLIQAGEIDESPLGLFHRTFLNPLRHHLSSSPGSIAILIPSVRDLISSNAVYPQCELGPRVTKADPRIRLLPNPASFSINGVKFAATSVDVLFHLRKEEVVKRGEEHDSVIPPFQDDAGTDPMANTCRHVLQQRSFYPVFPVPLEEANEVNLDITHSAQLTLGYDGDEEQAPDVLILPSKFRHFCKSVHSTIAINPSTAAKGIYASINVHSSSPGTTLKDRLKSELVKMTVEEM